MTDIASALKAEISRIARKELRKETAVLKKAATSYRSEIADLKRRVLSLERDLKRSSKAMAKFEPPVDQGGEELGKFRFSAKGFGSLRKRLGLSAEDAGLLLGTTSQTVYNWEKGKSHPRAVHIPAITGFRSLSKREAAEKLADTGEQA